MFSTHIFRVSALLNLSIDTSCGAHGFSLNTPAKDTDDAGVAVFSVIIVNNIGKFKPLFHIIAEGNADNNIFYFY